MWHIGISCLTLVALGAFGKFLPFTKVQKAMMDYEIEPGVVMRGPAKLLEVEFIGGENLTLGNSLEPEVFIDQPSVVNWDSNPNTSYTLAFIDPDYWTSSNEAPGCSFVHWLVGNIRGNDIESGETLYEYNNASTLVFFGKHRKVFLVYEQVGNEPYDFSNETTVAKNDTGNRNTFMLNYFFNIKYNFTGPLACNFFITQYPDDPISDDI